MEKQVISIEDLRKVKGIGPKAIERIKEQLEVSEEEANYISEYDEELHLALNDIHLGDCLELMNGIPDKSVDMILADLPYGTTACAWDTIIPFGPLWKQYERIVKDNGAIVLTSAQPFTTKLIHSNLETFKYSWYWNKVKPSNHLNAKKQPLRLFEDVNVFYREQPLYKPRMKQREKPVTSWDTGGQEVYGRTEGGYLSEYTHWYPDGHLVFSRDQGLHPTQKPVSLFEYLIKTYTNEGDIVLDNVIGSGTTAIASINTNRNYIGIEMDEEYHKIATERVAKHDKE